TIDKKSKKGELGIGGGIVWDSDPLHEFQEAKLKAKFVTEPETYFELIETMLVEKGEIFLLDYHIRRLKESVDHFLFYFDEESILNKMSGSIQGLDINSKYRLRLLLSKWGEIKIDISELSFNQENPKAVISNKKINSQNKYQFFKTTNRALYDEEYNSYKDEFTDIIFLNENGNIAEGVITNIIIRIGEKYYTPPIEDGILNGCYREYLLNSRDDINIKSFGINELLASEELILINSVRKEIKISELHKDGVMIKRFLNNEFDF
ncbi:MAG: hypothetical protein GXO85_04745, partial [Chlorobi bacterium]|nr:hypothetical protein [Chlorobiota bacterium]